MASKEKWKGRTGTEENICSTEQSLSSWNVDKQHKRQVVMETQSANTQRWTVTSRTGKARHGGVHLEFGHLGRRGRPVSEWDANLVCTLSSRSAGVTQGAGAGEKRRSRRELEKKNSQAQRSLYSPYSGHRKYATSHTKDANLKWCWWEHELLKPHNTLSYVKQYKM